MPTTFDLHHSTNLPADTNVQDVLNILHDPQQSIGLSPVVYSVKPDPTREESHFIVTERVPVLGGIYYPTTYRVKWTSVPNGCEWDVKANFGIRITNRMNVKNENGALVFADDLTSQVSVHTLKTNLGFQSDILATTRRRHL
jgi:hypothetical protein